METNATVGITTSWAVLGQVLTYLRREKKIKQNELAGRLCVSPSSWSRVEKGEIALSIDQLRAVSKELGIEPEDVLSLAKKVEEHLKSNRIDVRTELSTTKLIEKINSFSSGNGKNKDGGDSGNTFSSGLPPGDAVFTQTGLSIPIIPIVGAALGSIVVGAVASFLKK